MVTHNGFLIALLLAVVGSSLAFDYCNDNDTKCCGYRHIACQNNKQFGPQCKRSATIIPMTQNLINLILHGHNEARNLMANGTYGFPTSRRLGVIAWENSLAQVADYNVRQCNPVMDQCRNTEYFKFVGQNIGISNWNSREQQYTIEEVVRHQIRKWISQRRFATTQDMQSYPFKLPETTFGNFAVMMLQKANRVGCAIQRETEPDGYVRQAMTCNYSHDLVVGQPVYAMGPTASACNAGISPVYPNLCTVFEAMYPNQIGVF
uniref:SCP domain-containing protein n=1 Tax=Stomoxys calcitrans TaxID=35570 RepID=A0A1I8PQ91_STOCA